MKQIKVFQEHQYDVKDQFQTSKNQFLPTIFELPQQNKQIKSQFLLLMNNNATDKILTTHFTISKQYLIFYDPQFDNGSIKRNIKKETDSKNDKLTSKPKNLKRSIILDQKPFVQIYQPKNQQHQIQYKLFTEQQRKKVNIPGPGSYNISKSFAQPVYETIIKNDNTVLVKLNNIEGTVNFKSADKKLNAIYDKQKIQNPGPGYYAINTEQIRRKRNVKNKSKLEEYAKNYESNYKFIFQVFNSQYQTTQSIPNYKMTSPPTGTPYNGKPQKLKNSISKKDETNLIHFNGIQEKHNGNVKSSLQNYQYTKQRSLAKIIEKESGNQSEISSIFPIKIIDQQKVKQNKMKINSQFSEIIEMNKKQNQLTVQTIKDKNLKQKIKLLFQPRLHKSIEPKQYKKDNLYHRAGYYDGSQKQKLYNKYNVKIEKRNRTLNKILQPLPNRQTKIQSFDATTTLNINKYLHDKKITKRYDLNMVNLFLNANPFNNTRRLHLSNLKAVPNSDNRKIINSSYSTIEQH